MITYAYDNSEPGRLIEFGAHFLPAGQQAPDFT